MIEAKPRKLPSVWSHETARPLISLFVSQLPEVRRILDSRGIRYTVRDEAVSLDGAPETALIDLARGTDVEVVRALLDGVR